jgi:spermidine synthase
VTIFEELAWAETHEGLLTLRRRTEPTRGVDVYEVKIGDEFLMSSLFTVAEIELARLGLAAVPGEGDLDVVVGGLGLGYTAVAALEDPRVRSLIVVEAFAEVIDWHERRLLPDAASLADDDRVRFREADFFEAVRDGDGFDPDRPGGKVHAVLLDIDHTPRHILHDSHASFYTVDGLARLADNLHPGGVFALWSDDPPDGDFEAALASVFAESSSHVVTFPNFLTGGESSNTVYVSRTPPR